MAEPDNSFVEGDRSAEDMKAGAGSQLARKPDIEVAAARLRRSVQAQAPSHHRRRIRKAIEIIGDREVFREVAFPRRNDAAPSLGPAFHHTRSSWGRSHRPSLHYAGE